MHKKDHKEMSCSASKMPHGMKKEEHKKHEKKHKKEHKKK